jgi:hypothetical protein
MGDVGPVDDAGLCQMPCLIEAFEEADTVSEDEWHDVQLYLIDKPTGEALPGDVGAAPDCHVAVGGCLFRGSDRSCYAIGDEDELDRTARYRRRRLVCDHEVRHRVRRVLPAAGLIAGTDAPRPITMAPVVATRSSITGWLTSDGLKYQSYRPASAPPDPATNPSSETAMSRRTSAMTTTPLRPLMTVDSATIS